MEDNRTPEEKADDAFGINLDYDKLVVIFTRYFETDEKLLRETQRAFSESASFQRMVRQTEKVFNHVLPEERPAGIMTYRIIGQAIEKAMKNLLEE